MPPKTRKSKQEGDEEDVTSDVLDDTNPAKLPESDLSYSRKIVISKSNSLPNSRIIKLRHPKEGCALFRISDSFFDEVLAVNDGHRSFFYGESVIENGTIHILCPFNPVFVCLPYLQKTASKFVEISEILVDETFELIKELAENDMILKSLEAVADVKDVMDVKLYRLNEQKMLQWMRQKFDDLKKMLEVDAHKSLVDAPDVFDRHVFTFLSDYLSSDIASIVKSHLNIQEAVVSENIDMSMKRKSAEDEYDTLEKPVAKKTKESVQAKKLQAASKGTKSISSFFGKK